MSEHLRDRLHEEMSRQQLPPAGDLIDRAVAGAVRTRTLRRRASGAGTVAVVGLTVLAVCAGGRLGAGPSSAPSALQAGSPAAGHVVIGSHPLSSAKPSLVRPTAVQPTVVQATAVAPEAVEPTPAASQPVVGDTPVVGDAKSRKEAAGHAWTALQTAASAANPPQWTAAPPGLPATPQGELQLFAELAKPYGTASHFGVSGDADKTHVRAYLTAPDGSTGMLQFSMYHDTLGWAGDCLPKPPAYLKEFGDLGPSSVSCRHTSDGGYVVRTTLDAGCVDADDLTVVHPDGTAVWVNLATCLVDDANNTTPGAQTLSSADAEAIFQDPRFDFAMPADVVARGAQDIGTLATLW